MTDERPFELFPDPVSRIDPDGAVLDQNRQSIARYGKGEGLPCHQLHFRREAPCDDCLLNNVIRRKSAERWFRSETEQQGRPPTYYEILLVPVLAADGRLLAVEEVIRDATASLAVEHHLIELSEDLGRQTHRLRKDLGELQKAQAALIQTEKLASLGKLAAGLTHEIHTPLGTLISNMDVLRHEIESVEAEIDSGGGDLSSRFASVRELMELHSIATDRIRKILRSLKLFAHLDRAVFEKVDLHEGIEAALNLLTYETRGRIEIVKRYGDLPPVMCRPDAVNQVFMNLLQNAVQAIEGKGTITIHTSLKGDRHVLLEFEDDGRGIPAEQVSKIFDPGFTSRTRGVGSGLGLAIAYQTVASHNGSIEVASTEGKGTKFSLSLPIVQKPEST